MSALLGVAWWISYPVLLLAANPKAVAPPSKLSDPQLEQAIRARFAKSKISEEKFQVRVERGVAILEGKTNVIQRKGAATRLARLAGAANVRNNIEVSQEAVEKASQNLATGRRRAQVTRGEVRTQK